MKQNTKTYAKPNLIAKMEKSPIIKDLNASPKPSIAYLSI
jgi:hypothetical protein